MPNLTISFFRVPSIVRLYNLKTSFKKEFRKCQIFIRSTNPKNGKFRPEPFLKKKRKIQFVSFHCYLLISEFQAWNLRAHMERDQNFFLIFQIKTRKREHFYMKNPFHFSIPHPLKRLNGIKIQTV